MAGTIAAAKFTSPADAWAAIHFHLHRCSSGQWASQRKCRCILAAGLGWRARRHAALIMRQPWEPPAFQEWPVCHAVRARSRRGLSVILGSTTHSHGPPSHRPTTIKRVGAYSKLSQLGYLTVASAFGLRSRDCPPHVRTRFQGAAVPAAGS